MAVNRYDRKNDRRRIKYISTSLSYEDDFMRILLKPLEREVRHGVPKGRFIARASEHGRVTMDPKEQENWEHSPADPRPSEAASPQ